MATKNETMTKLADKLNQRFSSIEIVLYVIVLIAWGMRMQGIQASGLVFTISLSALAAIYFISAYVTTPEEMPRIEKFVNTLTCFGCAVTITGILFFIQRWHGFERMIPVGCLTLLGSIFFNLTKSPNKKNSIRPVCIVVVAIFLLFTPKQKLTELHVFHSMDNASTK